MRLGLPAIETINVDTYETWPKWAKGLSIGHKARLDEPNPAFVLPDLLVHYVRGELISGETFSGQEEHRIFSFHGCTLVNCIFYGPRGVKFDRCRLINCRFEEMSPQKPGWDLSYDKSELLNTPSHKEGMFLFVGLSLSLNIIDCYVSNIWLHNVKLRYLYLSGTFGLPTCHGMQSIEIPPDEVRRSNTQIMDTPVGWFDRYASWEQLRAFGRLPLFGTSLSALVSIPIIFYLLAEYNSHIRRLQENTAALPKSAAELVVKLTPLPIPSLSLWLLISTLLLGIASTIFSIACPPRVREFSSAQWTDELAKPALIYLADARHRRAHAARLDGLCRLATAAVAHTTEAAGIGSVGKQSSAESRASCDGRVDSGQFVSSTL